MTLRHQNDPKLISDLLADPGIWVVVGLSTNQKRTAYSVSRWLRHELHKGIIAVHPKAETVFGQQGYASISDIPDGTDVKVVDCFVNSDHVGAVVDEAIANKDRLQIDAIWMQLGVVDEAAADRAREAGLDVVMDTCPKIEYRGVRSAGAARDSPPRPPPPGRGAQDPRRAPSAAPKACAGARSPAWNDTIRSRSCSASCPSPAPRMRAASRPALRAPPIDTVATGTPAGIWTIESSESMPSRCASGTGTPMTGKGVTEASMPGRCAAPPAPAMTTRSPRATACWP